MTDQDYIRKAVELADGFRLPNTGNNRLELAHTKVIFSDCDSPEQWLLDTLAAQLVRQMDALILYRVQSEPTGTFIHHEGTGERISDSCLAGNRTMNIIKAIVDSKVLE